jgi:class 3 adenylate cyclase
MDLTEQLDPEEWHKIMDRFFAILSEGIHRFEGTVNQYTGDGIMALFGGPIAHEDHAQRACYAALPAILRTADDPQRSGSEARNHAVEIGRVRFLEHRRTLEVRPCARVGDRSRERAPCAAAGALPV